MSLGESVAAAVTKKTALLDQSPSRFIVRAILWRVPAHRHGLCRRRGTSGGKELRRLGQRRLRLPLRPRPVCHHHLGC